MCWPGMFTPTLVFFPGRSTIITHLFKRQTEAWNSQLPVLKEEGVG